MIAPTTGEDNYRTARLNYTVSQKNVPPLSCYKFDIREWIWIFFWQKCYQ